MQIPKLDLPRPPTFTYGGQPEVSSSGFDVYHPSQLSSNSSAFRIRRPSLNGRGSLPVPRRQNSFIDFAGSSQNVANLPPPVVPEAMAPLQLDSSRAHELEQEEPLSLPRPWALDRASTLSALSSNYPRGGGAGGAAGGSQSSSNAILRGLPELSRTRSRSPERGMPRSYLDGPAPSAPLPSHLAALPDTESPKVKFVEGLVGAACIAVNVVWKPSPEVVMVNVLPTPRTSPTGIQASSDPNGVLPLRHFIKEVLRRSRSTCSTLQTALYYIHKSRDAIRQRIRESEEAKVELLRLRSSGNSWANGATSLPSPPYDDEMEGTRLTPRNATVLLAKTRDPVLCGRRMFLAALICASKFLQDRTYSNRAWSKISSLPVQEINVNEKAFLELLGYNLYVDADLYKSCELLFANSSARSSLMSHIGTRRLQDLADKHERKTSSAGHPSAELALPKPNLSLLRDGLLRSQSDYLPAPEKLSSPRAAAPSHFGLAGHPYTPAESPRQVSNSPENARTPLGMSVDAYPGLPRSHTDPRFDHNIGRMASLGSGAAIGGGLSAARPSTTGRLPVPNLSIRIPSHLPASPSPLSSRMLPTGEEDEQRFLSSSLGRSGRPALSKRYATSVRDVPDGLLPRPSLSRKNFEHSGSASFDAGRRTSGSCSSLARLLNDGSDWRAGDDMVI
jgi:hypothetical protein